MVAPEDRFAGSSKKKSSQAAQHTKRRVRTKFKPYQIERLESSFEEAKYPTSAQRSQLARDLALTDLCVQVWFQNRRARMKPPATHAALMQHGGVQHSTMQPAGVQPIMVQPLMTAQGQPQFVTSVPQPPRQATCIPVRETPTPRSTNNTPTELAVTAMSSTLPSPPCLQLQIRQVEPRRNLLTPESTSAQVRPTSLHHTISTQPLSASSLCQIQQPPSHVHYGMPPLPAAMTPAGGVMSSTQLAQTPMQSVAHVGVQQAQSPIQQTQYVVVQSPVAHATPVAHAPPPMIPVMQAVSHLQPVAPMHQPLYFAQPQQAPVPAAAPATYSLAPTYYVVQQQEPEQHPRQHEQDRQ